MVYCEARDSVAALVCGAYNRNPGNRLLSHLVTRADTWPELASAGVTLIEGTAYVYAPREVEVTYLSAQIERYQVWAEKYTPLAGIAEVRSAAASGPRLDLPLLFMPTGFEKLEEYGFGLQREVKRVAVADLRQAIGKYKRLVVLGEPGSGKTTTLWRLTYDLATSARVDPATALPLFVPLGGYTGAETALEYVQSHCGDLVPHLPAYLAQGRIVLLLDGLNEMPQRGRQERVGRIQTLLARFGATPALGDMPGPGLRVGRRRGLEARKTGGQAPGSGTAAGLSAPLSGPRGRRATLLAAHG